MAPEKKPKIESVSKGEFDDFKKSVEGTQSKMLDILEEMSKQKSLSPDVNTTVQAAKATAVVEDALPQQEYLPVPYQKVMGKYFDPADGFEGFLKFPTDDDGTQSAITFTIIVPDKFSNRDPAHKKHYKNDVRMVALKPENIIRGIDSWCSKVAKNLRYNKLLKTK